jgi:hypothetical protein
VVTGDPPPACVEAEAGGLVKKFLTAYNGGEHRMTDTYFAPDGVFEEFVVPFTALETTHVSARPWTPISRNNTGDTTGSLSQTSCSSPTNRLTTRGCSK